MAYYKDDFNDNCFELKVLRKFRDEFVPHEEVKHYYMVAPIIVKNIKAEKYSATMFEKIYIGVVKPCVADIINKNYAKAYERYKNTILAFENKYCNQQELSGKKSHEQVGEEQLL